MRGSKPELLARGGNRRGSRSRSVLDHPVAVRCPYRHPERYSVTDSVSYANRQADTHSVGLSNRYAVTQAIQTVAQPIEAVSEAHLKATAPSVRAPERSAVPGQIRLGAGRDPGLS